jgi:hypothetical protein
MTGSREPLSQPSSRHGEARQPLPLTFLRLTSRERPVRLSKQTSSTLEGGGHRKPARAGAKPGLVGFRRLRVTSCPPIQCACGAILVRKPRPREQGRRFCGKERVISPAPNLGALRGGAQQRWVWKRQLAGSDQGGAFLPQNTLSYATLRAILITW